MLIEFGMYEWFEKIVLVYVSRDIQKQRLMQRDNLSEKQAESRLQAQMPLEEKSDYAHYVIYNQGAVEHTQKQVQAVWKDLWRNPTG